jgi:NADPH-dependent 2,4-dienoyl-CoA reductase/sulfur reductase-like enzyme
MNRLQSSDHVIVVGAGLAGWRFVESLRREGYEGALTLIGDEPYAPYDRPPLSKQVLAGKWDLDKTTLASPEQLIASKATLRLGVRATSLDVTSRSVQLSDGSRASGTHLVLATGSRARPLAFESSGPLPTLRTHDDLVHFRSTLESLDSDSVVAVIGGGFVGAEVATSTKTRGFTPIVLEAAARPLITVLGEEVSEWLLPLASDAGVELRTNQRLRDVTIDDECFVLHFDDGTHLNARAVLAAVGSTLDLEWLEGSGLNLDHGVVVDRDLLAAPFVAAIGDVARFAMTTVAGNEVARIEHWQIATDHARELAHHWMGGARSLAFTMPYFWSDQYGKKIQMLGHPHVDDDVVRVSGSLAEGKWLALYSRGGLVTGLVSLSQPRDLALAKPLLEAPTTLAEALHRAPWIT